MKLYKLELKPAARKLVPSYDIMEACIVRAISARDARVWASIYGADEKRLMVGGVSMPTWLKPEYSTCRELKATGKAGIVMQDIIGA